MSLGITMSYSESFRQQVVRDVESGKYTMYQAQQVYGIKGNSTIRSWIDKYGAGKSVNKRVRVETPEEIRQIKLLQAERDELKRGLSDAFLKVMRLEASLAIAEERLGESIEKKTK